MNQLWYQADWGYKTASTNLLSTCGTGSNMYNSNYNCAPNAWGNKYPTCSQKATSTQSPIDIANAVVDDTLMTPSFVTMSPCLTWTQINSLDDVAIDLTQPGYQCTSLKMQYEGYDWILQEMRFKSPSEHTLGGGYYDAEAQMIHVNPTNGHIAIASVFLSATNSNHSNVFLNNLWQAGGSKLSTSPNMLYFKNNLLDDFSPYTDFLPGSRNHFQYIGSLTEPPCSEDVDWFIFKDPVVISQNDLKIIRSIPLKMTGNYLSSIGDNNRPLQNGYNSIQPTLIVKYTDGTTQYGSTNVNSNSNAASISNLQQQITSVDNTSIAAIIFALLALFLSAYNTYVLTKFNAYKTINNSNTGAISSSHMAIKNPMRENDL